MKNSLISVSLLTQSLPSLLFSLISLALAGKWLDDSLKLNLYLEYPLLLISSCVLTFKGNIELILAMHLSTMSQSRSAELNKYYRFAFDNSCLVITQSAVIGFLIGLLGAIRNFLAQNLHKEIFFKIIASVLVSCFFSSFCIIIMILISIKLSKTFKIDPDHIILPGISAFSDVFVIRMCIFFIKFFNFTTLSVTFLFLLTVIFFTSITFYFSLKSERIIPQQTIEMLFLSYMLSSFAGYILDFFSKDFRILAIFEPVFCGMCCSTALIYLHKKATALENGVSLNNRKIISTLLIISFFIGCFYLSGLLIFMKKFIFSFFLFFLVFFVCNVYILLSFIKLVLDNNQISNPNIGVFAIPLISSLSDFIGVVMSVIVVVCVSFFQYLTVNKA
ncbi:hypothetical protein TUBRATIS_001420 [Tubulinosema ratisbonensis]|uniref:SLC41A/MgtE integral membrane domain-containing protein n=1 Tax=Tubulinosema ratisbonensis TaxID=291195 RepID=A0A437AQN4_9MICR|nr:hypothetical protein TUBRATIS_001420 [Tubulinosema ratisbonensis]